MLIQMNEIIEMVTGHI